MNKRLVARHRLVRALGYGRELDDASLMTAAAVHLEQISQSYELPEYLLVPPGVHARGEDFLSPKLEVEANGQVVITGGDEACYLSPDLRLFYRKVPKYPLPWADKGE